jgi:hypothetical protein
MKMFVEAAVRSMHISPMERHVADVEENDCHDWV